MIIVYMLLTQKEAVESFKNLKKWFKNNSKRRVCNTDRGKVRRNHLKEDFLKYCKSGVKLKD